ncbi:hypothetical protein C8R44DRAFT_805315, partial [Mycena epipterygia]
MRVPRRQSAPSQASASPTLGFRYMLHRCLDLRVPRQYVQTQESRRRQHHPCSPAAVLPHREDSCIRGRRCIRCTLGRARDMQASIGLRKSHVHPAGHVRNLRTGRAVAEGGRSICVVGSGHGAVRRRFTGKVAAAAGMRGRAICGLDTNPGGRRGGTERHRRRDAYGEGGGLRWTFGEWAPRAISREMTQGCERARGDGLESQRKRPRVRVTRILAAQV